MKNDDGITLLSITRTEYDRLKEIEETLLALEWAQECFPDPHCDNCPMYKPSMCPLFDVALLARGGNKTWCQELAFLHKSEWLKAYRERDGK